MFSLIYYKNIHSVTQKWFSKLSLISETDTNLRKLHKCTFVFCCSTKLTLCLTVLPVIVSWSNNMDTHIAKVFINVPFKIYSSMYARSNVWSKNGYFTFCGLMHIFHWFPNRLFAPLTKFYEYVYHFLTACQTVSVKEIYESKLSCTGQLEFDPSQQH
jgi:hypothetical protein